MMRIAWPFTAFLFAGLLVAGPRLDRVSPLGGQAGAVHEVELKGSQLGGTTGVSFDNGDLEWIETVEVKPDAVRGKVRVAPGASLGPHFIRIAGKHGPSNTRLFNVTQFPGVAEIEPNNTLEAANPIPFRPQVVYGYMQGLADSDLFSFTARSGERWLFDVQSIERGGFLECSLTLYDDFGREVGFNEDQDEYLETPRLEYTFERSGRYVLKIDQYRGPQGVSCGQNCGYLLQMSQLPIVLGANPLGARVGSKVIVDVLGHALGGVREIYLTPVRGAEYYRLTFPFSMPLRFEEAATGSGQRRISGRVLSAETGRVRAEFPIPSDAVQGLWRMWAVSPEGKSEGINLEIGRHAEFAEGSAGELDWRKGEIVLNGTLDKPREEDAYSVELTAGVPFHAWTLATQLGLPFIDTVLELFDANGKLLADHDDLMTGQGTVIGNPDSSLYFTPKASGRARLVVRDRTGRGGETYAYRLHLASQAPSFQLLTEPEEFSISPGSDAELETLLIREPGFDEAVDVWIEGLPKGATASRGQFRSDQVFGPSGDGDNINIPAVPLKIHLPETIALGEYPIRVFGKAASGGSTVEAFTTLWIGPRGKRNDTRRPLPRIVLHAALKGGDSSPATDSPR